MNINFNDATFEKLKFLATADGRSVAAYVSMRMDELTDQLVNTQYSMNNLPDGTPLAHVDPSQLTNVNNFVISVEPVNTLMARVRMNNEGFRENSQADFR